LADCLTEKPAQTKRRTHPKSSAHRKLQPLVAPRQAHFNLEIAVGFVSTDERSAPYLAASIPVKGTAMQLDGDISSSGGGAAAAPAFRASQERKAYPSKATGGASSVGFFPPGGRQRHVARYLMGASFIGRSASPFVIENATGPRSATFGTPSVGACAPRLTAYTLPILLATSVCHFNADALRQSQFFQSHRGHRTRPRQYVVPLCHGGPPQSSVCEGRCRDFFLCQKRKNNPAGQYGIERQRKHAPMSWRIIQDE